MKSVLPERIKDLKDMDVKQAIEEIERYIEYIRERLEVLNKTVNKLVEGSNNNG